jgi:hypothetical protein
LLPLAASLAEKAEAAPAPLVPLAAPAAASPAAAPAMPAAPLAQPHDFSALVDRLAAAREAAQPQAISVSLPHTDFGRVQLSFRHEDGTLAVSLASQDPDFARIAAQSAPPVLPVAESRSAENNSGQPGARGDSQSGAAAQHGGERRPAAEQRSDPEARFDQRPRSRSANEPAPTRDERRGGVFA